MEFKPGREELEITREVLEDFLSYLREFESQAVVTIRGVEETLLALPWAESGEPGRSPPDEAVSRGAGL